jgi:hypothetical protein
MKINKTLSPTLSLEKRKGEHTQIFLVFAERNISDVALVKSLSLQERDSGRVWGFKINIYKEYSLRSFE